MFHPGTGALSELELDPHFPTLAIPVRGSPFQIAAGVGLVQIDVEGYRLFRRSIEFPPGEGSHRFRLEPGRRLSVRSTPGQGSAETATSIWWREASRLEAPWNRLGGESRACNDGTERTTFEASWSSPPSGLIEWFGLDSWSAPVHSPQILKVDPGGVTPIDLVAD